MQSSNSLSRIISLWGLIIISGLITLWVIFQAFNGSPPDFEVRRLYFAAGVLSVLAFLLILGIAVCTWGPSAEKDSEAPGKLVFDSLIKVIPPIITLVLGFYFGQQAPPPAPPLPDKRAVMTENSVVSNELLQQLATLIKAYDTGTNSSRR